MKVIAFNGSQRRGENTNILINYVFDELQKEGIETDLFSLEGKKIHDCRACYKCFENRNKRCSIESDIVNECIEKMTDSDGIILGSPAYSDNVSTELKTLIDRAGLVAIANGHMFKRKLGAAVVAVRQAGAINVFNSINAFFLINQMIIPGSSYWNEARARRILGLQKDEMNKDEEAILAMKNLGENMAWALKKLRQ